MRQRIVPVKITVCPTGKKREDFFFDRPYREYLARVCLGPTCAEATGIGPTYAIKQARKELVVKLRKRRQDVRGARRKKRKEY